jgi:hypothetical protein
MKTIWMVALLLGGALVGCCDAHQNPAASSQPAPDDTLIVPGVRVGQYVLGRSTAASILGSDSPEARRKFAEQGLFFEFERGQQLTGIMVSSPKYATQNGLRVGATAADVEAQLGTPLSRTMSEAHGKFEIPGLSYPGIWFVLEGTVVGAIRVGK